MEVHELDQLLLIGSGVLILAILAVRLSVTAGLPSLLVYLGLGLLLGNAGLGISFDDPDLALVLGFAALVLILAEGGLSTKWEHIRPSMGFGVLLATLGSAISVIVVGIGAHYLLNLDWELAFLLAAVMTPTDAAAVFSVLRTAPSRLNQVSTTPRSSFSSLRSAPVTSPTAGYGRSRA